jgi:predicted nucleic acid-binding protein
MILLDTNVVSETMKPKNMRNWHCWPEKAVKAFQLPTAILQRLLRPKDLLLQAATPRLISLQKSK